MERRFLVNAIYIALEHGLDNFGRQQKKIFLTKINSRFRERHILLLDIW